MIKISGALLVIGAFFYIGQNVAQNLKKRALTLSELIAALQIIKSEIVYKGAPLCEIVSGLAERGGSFTGKFFGDVAEKMKAQRQSVFYAAWVESLARLCFLNEDDRALVCELGNVLGQHEAQTQEEAISCAAKRLELKLRAAEDEYEKKGKLYRTLGTGFGVITVLILI